MRAHSPLLLLLQSKSPNVPMHSLHVPEPLNALAERFMNRVRLQLHSPIQIILILIKARGGTGVLLQQKPKKNFLPLTVAQHVLPTAATQYAKGPFLPWTPAKRLLVSLHPILP